jgi:hypothetical protein
VGFKYKSGFVWTKERPGTGFWAFNRHEHLLVGARGSGVCPRFRGIKWRESVIDGQQRGHSHKPDLAAEIIEWYHCDAAKLELFARETRPGWDAWGDQVGLFDDGPVPTRRWPSSGPGVGLDNQALRALPAIAKAGSARPPQPDRARARHVNCSRSGLGHGLIGARSASWTAATTGSGSARFPLAALLRSRCAACRQASEQKRRLNGPLFALDGGSDAPHRSQGSVTATGGHSTAPDPMEPLLPASTAPRSTSWSTGSGVDLSMSRNRDPERQHDRAGLQGQIGTCPERRLNPGELLGRPFEQHGAHLSSPSPAPAVTLRST